MFKNTSIFPRIFIYILSALSILIFVGMFFSFRLVEIFYFVTILVAAVFLILDKKYGKSLTNHKAVFFLFDFINLIAIITVLYYEYSKHNSVLNAFLIALICVVSILLIIDFVFISDKFSFKKEFIFIDVLELCSMICIYTYFNKVSEFWFAVTAFVFFIFNLAVKIAFTIKLKYYNQNIKKRIETDNVEVLQDESIESLIQSEDEQGELE